MDKFSFLPKVLIESITLEIFHITVCFGCGGLLLNTPDKSWQNFGCYPIGNSLSFLMISWCSSDLYPLMVLYSNPSENKSDKNSNKSFSLAEMRLIYLERNKLPHFWSDETSAEYCFRRPSILLRLIFDSDAMGVGFGLGL